MKNLKKFGALIVMLSLTPAVYSMEELEGEVAALQESLVELKGKLEDLQERVTGLESGEKVTHKICSGGKKEKCKKVSAEQAQAFVNRHHRRGKRAFRCHRGQCRMMHPMVKHGNIQQEFQELRNKFGLPAVNLSEIKARGPQRGQPLQLQMQFNTLRSQLTALLAQETLTKADIKEIYKKIDEFKKLNPARRPSPEDYQEILSKRLKLMKAKGEESSEGEESESEE